MRVLYVEDNPADIDLVRRALSRDSRKFTMTPARSLREARELLQNDSAFDVGLIDLTLPDGDGMDLLAETRESDSTLPVLILTGSGDERRAVAALRAGAADYVVKRRGFETAIAATLAAAVDRSRHERSVNGRTIHVLYCEHDEGDTDLTRRALERHAPNIRLSSCHSAEQVYDLLSTPEGRQSCDVLLLDYRLPGDSGLSILKWVRIERGYDIPVVIVTGQGDEDVAALAMRIGAADYVVKHAGYLDALPAVLQNAFTRAQLDREQAALRRKTEELDRFFSSTIDLLCVVDQEGRFVRLNREWERTLGYSMDRLEGMSFMDLVHPEDRKATIATYAALQAGSEVDRFVNRYRREDGQYRYLEWRANPSGDLIYAAARDITERLEAERAARAAETRLHQAVTSGNIGFWDWNLQSDIVYYSPEWKRQLGYAEDEIANRYEEWESRLHPDDRERVIKMTNEYRENPSGEYHIEYRLRHRDGSYRYILSRGGMVQEYAGAPARLIGTHIDMTEQKALEEQFIHSQKMEGIGRLAGGVAHDFNNLLSVINGYTELALKSLPEDHPVRHDIAEVHAAGERAAMLTRQLLAFSRRQMLQPVVVNVDYLVRELSRMLQRLIGEDIEMTIDLNAPSGRIRIDPGQLEQVLVNLVVNARDAMPHGGRLVIASAEVDLDEAFAESHHEVQTGRHIELTVTDNGVGMSRDTASQIFEPFFTTKERGQGTGLGLAMVHGIIEQSGGHIYVYSEPGVGTSFKIYLPLAEAPIETVHRTPASRIERGTECILLVEDDDRLRKLAERILTESGYTVIAAGDGMEAIEFLTNKDHAIDLLLTDVIMPQISGPDLAAHARQLRPGLKVLYMSGYSDDMISHRGDWEHPTALITKPFTAAQITRQIREVMDSADATATDQSATSGS